MRPKFISFREGFTSSEKEDSKRAAFSIQERYRLNQK